MTSPRNDPCWCGSGRKYKKCHLDRDGQVPPTFEEVQEGIRRSYSWKTCLHPDAPRGCGAVIRAHTIQRSGVLDRIARNGHVYTLRAKNGGPPVYTVTVREVLVGIKEASTFPGFCSRHDDELFSAIEKQGFEVSEESALLLGFRSLCYGYHQTTAGLRALDYFGRLDQGAAPNVQTEWQSFLRQKRQALRLSIEIAEAQRTEIGDRMHRRDFRGVHYYALVFSERTTLAAAFGWHPTHDFEDRRLNTLDNGKDSNLLLWSALPAERGGVCLYVWLGQQPASMEFIRSLRRVADSKVAHAMVGFSSLCENTYLDPAWWDALPGKTKEVMRTRLRATFDQSLIKPGLEPGAHRLVDWGTVRRVTNLSAADLGATTA